MRTSCYHPAMKHGVIENPMKLSHRTKPPFTSGISHPPYVMVFPMVFPISAGVSHGFPWFPWFFPMVFLWPKSHCLQDICWVKTNRLAPLDARGSVKSGRAGSNWSIELTEESYFWWIYSLRFNYVFFYGLILINWQISYDSIVIYMV